MVHATPPGGRSPLDAGLDAAVAPAVPAPGLAVPAVAEPVLPVVFVLRAPGTAAVAGPAEPPELLGHPATASIRSTASAGVAALVATARVQLFMH